ncbi:divergent polysaccharide deacetylase family protein [Maricaulaceae bacterium MS644]
MARFSFPFVQLAAGIGAVAMVLTGQWLGAQETAAGPASPSIEPPAFEPPAFAPQAITESRAVPPRPQERRLYEPRVQRQADTAPRDAFEASAPAPPAFGRQRLAVIIDDIGHDMEAARALLALDAPVTLSVLPYAEFAPQTTALARGAGREVFLHLPMEPVGLDDPGPGAVTTALSPAEIARRVETALARTPGVAGLNNHMGSRASAHAPTMAAVFAALEGRGLIFVDSLTHPGSVAAEAARAAGLTAFDRDVFLDAPGADPALQLDAALARALETGQAIAIGHPYPGTLAALAELRAKAEAAGVALVPVSGLAGGGDAPS